MFRVAETLGMTVSEIEARMLPGELIKWAAYEKVYGPLGQARLDILFASLMAVTVNASGNSKKSYGTNDFLPKWDGDRPQSIEEQKAMIAQFTNDFGGPALKPGSGKHGDSNANPNLARR